MEKTTYTVISKEGANLRLYPSGSYPTKEPVGWLGYLESVSVIRDWDATNTVGGATRYLPVLVGGAVRYVSARLVQELSPAQRAELAADYVYRRIYDLEAEHRGAGGVVSMATLEENRRISCGRAASLVLQLAGVLPTGKIINHTEPDGGGGSSKTTLTKAMTGAGLLLDGTYDCRRVNCLFRELPEAWKRKGSVYIQDSNVCVSAGDGKIYSCNKSGKVYGKNGEPVLRTGGYPFTAKLLYVILPRR